MKTLAIENDWDIPDDLQAFADLKPDLIGELTVLRNARMLPADTLREKISQFTQFLLESTFIYKDQLESLKSGFAAGLFGPGPFTFYIPRIVHKLEQWTEKRDGDYTYGARGGFLDHEKFMNTLISLVEVDQLRLFEIRVHDTWIDKNTGQFPDDLDFENEDQEKKFTGASVTRVRFDRHAGEFYRENDNYDTDPNNLPHVLNIPR